MLVAPVIVSVSMPAAGRAGDRLVDSWFFVGVVAAALTTFGFVPQILKMYETKSAQDVSLITFVQFSAGVALWVFYGMSIGDPIVVVANIITFCTLIVAVLLYIRYHHRMRDAAGHRAAEDW